jgi:hypothetical protein
MRFGAPGRASGVAALFIDCGTEKLFGWFGGRGPEGTARLFGLLTGAVARATRWSRRRASSTVGDGLLTPLAAPAH